MGSGPAVTTDSPRRGDHVRGPCAAVLRRGPNHLPCARPAHDDRVHEATHWGAPDGDRPSLRPLAEFVRWETPERRRPTWQAIVQMFVGAVRAGR